jgi:hypothetical protein
MGGAEAWARNKLQPHPRIHELGASAADIAQHPVQPIPPTHESHILVKIACGGLGQVTG